MKETQLMIQLSGYRWFSRCAVVLLAGLLMNLIVVIFLTGFYFDLLPASYGAESHSAQSQEEDAFNRPNFSSLNVRLSSKRIVPPQNIVQRTVHLEGFQSVLPVTESEIRSVIIEDDGRRHVLVLSTHGTVESDEPLYAYLLYDFDLESHIPTLRQCVQKRQCAHSARDRQPGTGGLACLAICMVHALHSTS